MSTGVLACAADIESAEAGLAQWNAEVESEFDANPDAQNDTVHNWPALYPSLVAAIKVVAAIEGWLWTARKYGSTRHSFEATVATAIANSGAGLARANGGAAS